MNGRKKNKILLKDYYNQKYQNSLSDALATDNDEKLIDKLGLKTGKYSLKTAIKRNTWLNSGRPASMAIKWLYQEVFRNPDKYRHSKRLLFQGNLYAFEYKYPKFKDTLEYFDKYPLVIALGPVTTSQGIRNIGFNLHLLPVKIRIVVLCLIFELFKKLYRYKIYNEQDNKPIKIQYGIIIKKLEQYGIKFCVRMYIPNRMNTIIKFPYKEWYKAIFIPSRGYAKIRAQQLEKKWKEFLKVNKLNITPNAAWSNIMK